MLNNIYKFFNLIISNIINFWLKFMKKNKIIFSTIITILVISQCCSLGNAINTSSTPMEIILGQDFSFQTSQNLEMNHSKYSHYSDLDINISQIDYRTSFTDLNVIGANASVPTNNPYPNATYSHLDLLNPIGSSPNQIALPTYDKTYIAFEDLDFQHYSAWAEARSWNISKTGAFPEDTYEFHHYNIHPEYQIPLVNVSVEVAVEIVNGRMDLDGELNYETYWDLILHYYKMTLEAISDPRLNSPLYAPFNNILSLGNEIVIAENMTWKASLMYRNEGNNGQYIFDQYSEISTDGYWDGVIDTMEILNNADHLNLFTSFPNDPSSMNHWDYDNRNISQSDIDASEGVISEGMFNDYGLWKGYQSNYGNPIIVFNFTATGEGFNHLWMGNEYGFWGYYPPLSDKTWTGANDYPNMNENYYRAGGVDPTGLTIPPNLLPDTCWAKIKITEFDSKHSFNWNDKQIVNGNYSDENDVYAEIHDEDSWQTHSINKTGKEILIKGEINRLPLNSTFNFTTLKTDLFNGYEFMNVSVNQVKVTLYIDFDTDDGGDDDDDDEDTGLIDDGGEDGWLQWLWIFIGIMALIGLFGFYVYEDKRQKRRSGKPLKTKTTQQKEFNVKFKTK